MSNIHDDPGASLRRAVYCLLILIGGSGVLARIMAVDAIDRTALQTDRMKRVPDELKRKRENLMKAGVAGPQLEEQLQRAERDLTEKAALRRPFLSGNDRSRWCTVRALVEPEMRVEGAPYAIDKVIQQPNWDTIDMVKHDGHLYSSKPTLLPTLMAGQYWLIYNLTGKSLAGEPFEVGRFMLISINLLCLLVYFFVLARLVERLGKTDWGRIFVMAAAVFGTLLTTFAVVINNHLVAAACAAVALDMAYRIWFEGERRWQYFILGGLFSALLGANELPAAALSAALSLAILWKAPRQTLLAYVPAGLVVTAGFFGTNWIAHRSLIPAYLHRSEGDNWYDYTYERGGRTIVSYWKDSKAQSPIDRGEASPARYAMHALVGHHGIFSLTPIWLLSVAGLLMWLKTPDRGLRELALLIGVISVVCVGFYLARPLADRNYGGSSSGFRWAFWLAPLWLLAMLPAADALSGRRWTRGVALALLAVSVFSASYPIWNPWTHPWIMEYMTYMGWL